jgi:hypothetical protein
MRGEEEDPRNRSGNKKRRSGSRGVEAEERSAHVCCRGTHTCDATAATTAATGTGGGGGVFNAGEIRRNSSKSDTVLGARCNSCNSIHTQLQHAEETRRSVRQSGWHGQVYVCLTASLSVPHSKSTTPQAIRVYVCLSRRSECHTCA